MITSRTSPSRAVLPALVALVLAACTGAADQASWTELEPGLQVAVFDSRTLAAASAGDLTVLRVDPQRWNLAMLTAGTTGDDLARTPQQWCDEFGLTAAINAGMYQADYRTHVGFCQVDGKVLNKAPNDYLSALALDPVDEDDPPVRLFDLDEIDLADVTARYRTVVQNLRLIKHRRENRWQPASDRWNEAALAMDGSGRILLVQCSTPLSMHDFNVALLGLPLDVVAAQHLEGNLPARLWIAHQEAQGLKTQQGPPGRPLPFVLGVRPREGEVSAPGRPDR
ncbi:MAG: phosphodiester glycosidase family protein [bacterium]